MLVNSFGKADILRIWQKHVSCFHGYLCRCWLASSLTMSACLAQNDHPSRSRKALGIRHICQLKQGGLRSSSFHFDSNFAAQHMAKLSMRNALGGLLLSVFLVSLFTSENRMVLALHLWLPCMRFVLSSQETLLILLHRYLQLSGLGTLQPLSQIISLRLMERTPLSKNAKSWVRMEESQWSYVASWIVPRPVKRLGNRNGSKITKTSMYWKSLWILGGIGTTSQPWKR